MQYDTDDELAAPIGKSLIAATKKRSETLESGWRKVISDNDLIQTQTQPQMHAQAVIDTGMNWEHAKQYLASISQKNGQQVRLPSEAEWENLCRTVSKKLDR